MSGKLFHFFGLTVTGHSHETVSASTAYWAQVVHCTFISKHAISLSTGYKHELLYFPDSTIVRYSKVITLTENQLRNVGLTHFRYYHRIAAVMVKHVLNA